MAEVVNILSKKQYYSNSKKLQDIKADAQANNDKATAPSIHYQANHFEKPVSVLASSHLS